MKPFRHNLKLFIKILSAVHDPFLGVEFFDNDLMLGDISKYFLIIYVKEKK